MLQEESMNMKHGDEKEDKKFNAPNSLADTVNPCMRLLDRDREGGGPVIQTPSHIKHSASSNLLDTARQR
jgi:hypothetical protein